MLRIPSRGLVRVLTLTLATLAMVTLTGSAILAALGTNPWLILPVAAILATFWVLVLRGWAVGTYAHAQGIAVQRLLGTTYARWEQVARVRDVDGVVLVDLRDGSTVRTHLVRRGIDLLGSHEQFDVAKLALQARAEER